MNTHPRWPQDVIAMIQLPAENVNGISHNNKQFSRRLFRNTIMTEKTIILSYFRFAQTTVYHFSLCEN